MNNAWKLALGLVGCLIAIWVIAASNNKTYKVNYNTYRYCPVYNKLQYSKTRSCTVTIDGDRNVKVESKRIMYEVWDYELSNNRTFVADSISINVLQRVN